jgi:hypothetical protein
VSSAPTAPGWQRRWRRAQLRIQGQLDGDAADRLLPWLFAGLGFVVFAALDAAAIRSGEGGSGLAAWLQAAWRREHGGVGSPLGGVDPATGAWSWISEPILVLARHLPAEATFTTIQAAALASGVVPLWRLARDEAKLRVGATSVIAMAYLLAPALHRTNLSAFHPEALALPALLWAYLEGWRGHWKRYGALVAIVLLSHAALGLTVVALGALLVLVGRRRGGAITAAVGLGWSIVAVVVADAAAPRGPLTPSEQFVTRTVGPLVALPDLLTDPVGQLRLLISEPSVQFLVVILAPVLFLPLVAPRRFAAALPCIALAVIAEATISRNALRGVLDLSPTAAHVAPAMAFVFIALVFALERSGTLSVSRVNVDRRLVLALFAGALLLFIAESPTSPYQEPWSWGSRDAVDGARSEAAERIEPNAAVAVSPTATALVAERADVLELPLDPRSITVGELARISERADVILLDTTGQDAATEVPLWPAGQRSRVLRELEEAGFAVTYQAEGVLLLEPDT